MLLPAHAGSGIAIGFREKYKTDLLDVLNNRIALVFEECKRALHDVHPALPLEPVRVLAMTVLFTPSAEFLPGYVAALERGWSPDTLRPQAAAEHLALIRQDPDAFLAHQNDPEGKGPPVTLVDGSVVPRLPCLGRWIHKDGFAGRISLRWQPGTEALPPTCPGHVGYAVVPWRRREGLASAALIELLPSARALGIAHVDLATDTDNPASIAVIEKAGGFLVGEFETPAQLGGGTHVLFRIEL